MQSHWNPFDRLKALNQAKPSSRIIVAVDKANLQVTPAAVNLAHTDQARPVVEDHRLVPVAEGELLWQEELLVGRVNTLSAIILADGAA